MIEQITKELATIFEGVYFEWAERMARQEEWRTERRLIEEQDAAYRRSLAADQAKEELRRRHQSADKKSSPVQPQNLPKDNGTLTALTSSHCWCQAKGRSRAIRWHPLGNPITEWCF